MTQDAKRNGVSPDRTLSNGDVETLARLQLIRSENVGPITFFKLLERFGSAIGALEALPDLAHRGGKKRISICAPEIAEAELEHVQTMGASMVHWGTSSYPPLLAHIDDPPPILIVKGHTSLLRKRAIALVGARNASINGQRFARQAASEIGAAGYLVTSGMARGIDTAAHQGAISRGTIAVLGGGVDVVYPRENEKLYAEIVEKGAVCSEVPLGTTPQARHFPRRNRIISGISRGVVVVEAGARSGSLITARMGLEQGREVFAVPGAPQDPRVKGTNMLIRDGAMLTESAEDVLITLKEQESCAFYERPQTVLHDAPILENEDQNLPIARDHLLTALNFGPTDVDDVIRETEQSPQAIATALLELELAGRVARLPGNRICLVAE